MYGEPLDWSGCSTEWEFHDVLRRVVRRAAANGVDVRGSWVVETGGEDLDVEVVGLRRRR
jgi:hypothetical protein